jgi:cytochrome P450
LLRFEPPVQFIQNRAAMADIELDGVIIPKGSTVVLLLAAANRDSAQFLAADRFDPDRRDNQHLGFGSGVHSCFGAPLARLEAQIALRLFFERVVNPRLVGEPRYRPSPLLRGPGELIVAYNGVRRHIT